MKKQVIRLTESDLHRIIKESVNRILKEEDYETYVDKLRRQNAEKKASWDAFENTIQYGSDENIPTELDNSFDYKVNKIHHKFTSDHRPELNGLTRYTNFAKDEPYLKGFRAMSALGDDEYSDVYRDGEFWSGTK